MVLARGGRENACGSRFTGGCGYGQGTGCTGLQAPGGRVGWVVCYVLLCSRLYGFRVVRAGCREVPFGVWRGCGEGLQEAGNG